VPLYVLRPKLKDSELVVAARRSAQWQSIDAQLAALREAPVETDAAA
jgi:hypothetical protein